MSKLTSQDVLKAVTTAVSPFTAYIHDRICQDHRRRVGSGDVPLHQFEMPTVAMVLRRLRLLELDGFLNRSAQPLGNYGYEWTITEAGRAALQSRSTAP